MLYRLMKARDIKNRGGEFAPPKKLKTYFKNIKFVRFLKKKFLNKVFLSTSKKLIKNNKCVLSVKKRVKVLFIVLHKSVWKTDVVFLKMLNDPAFEPLILIAPYTIYGKDNMLNDMNAAYEYFKAKEYPVLRSYSIEDASWIEIDEAIKPDLIFMSNPHELTRPEYYDKLFKNYVCYYVPYDHQISNYGNNYSSQYNQLFHNAVYKIFSPHDVAKRIHQQYSDNKGRNVEVVGYPAMEVFVNKNSVPRDVWKKQLSRKIRIIWAPHHTIHSPELPYANFLKYFDFFQGLVQQYAGTVQWAFKPHPLLKIKLMNDDDWGEEKANRYWDFWRDHPSCQLEEGEYADLFLTSDAMIHDSGSFLVEYLYTNKPVLYLVSNDNIKNYFNAFGCEAFDACYHARDGDAIIAFIRNMFKKNDHMKQDREAFLEKNIFPYFQNDMPSDRIMKSIKKDFKLL